jgi:amino acid adenylation domain-containing protein
LGKENAPPNVLDEFASHVCRSPDAPALVSAEGTLTFLQLYDSAGELASRLRACGIGAGDIVGVVTGRTPALAVGLLATLRAGAAFCVLDPSHPPARLRRLQGAGLRCLITGTGDVAEPGAGAPVHGSRDARAESLAYVVFTSGSTGVPKAIGMPHRGLANMVAWTRKATCPAPLRTLQFAALGFDVLIQEVFTAWCSGGALYLPADEERNDLSRLVELIEEWGIERLFLPPLVLYRAAELANERNRKLATLREICVAGEALSITEAVRGLFKRLADCRLHNHYGPSETHVATAYTFPSAVEHWPDSPPIGEPVEGVRIRIVGDDGREVPAGAVGELYVAGAGVARGYLGDPVRTAERFVAGPAGARSYRTGDLALRTADGLIYFAGRNDDQSKIDGYRVEPGEVESALARHPLVRECAVAPWQAPDGEKRLVAYVVPRAGAQAQGFREHLAQSLPGFLVPRHVVVMTSLPITRNGKVDRASLPPPDQAGPPEGLAYEPPAGQLERDIAALWAAMLKVPRVGRHADFLELGGSSLMAGLMLFRFRQSHGIKVSLREFSADPTVRGLAEIGASRAPR